MAGELTVHKAPTPPPYQLREKTPDEIFEKITQYTVIEGKLAMKATGNRLIVLEDRFRTGYECKTCDGLGRLEADCKTCNGTRVIIATREGESDLACRTCSQDGRPTGKELCGDCKGKGATVIIPQTSERRTTSGKVMSCGPDVLFHKVTDHVLYGSYAGTMIVFQQKTVVRILHEDEVISLLYAARELNYSEVAL